MPLFQNTVVTRQLKTQNKTLISEKWLAYKAHFFNPAIQENIRNAKEEQYQEGFLRDLFVTIFGYTLNPETNFNLTTELKNAKDSKKADGGIIIDGTVVGVIELKGTNTTDLAKVEPQAFGYKNNQQDCVYVITSNFEKLRFYIDNAIEHIEFNLFTLSEEAFQLLYVCIAFENIKNNLPKKLKEESLSQEENITKQLYKDYSLFKRELFQNLTQLNPQFEALELFKKSQKLLDRFLFLFFSEDRNLLPPNSVRLILEQWKKLKDLDAYTPLYDRFKKYFGYLNTGFKGKQYDVFAYNGGLFKPDTILANITIDDALLYNHTLKLSEYDFESEVDVNILGHIFENSLNELDEVKAQLEGQSVDKTTTKRKKDGVFYTPKYITKYIVENTVGKLCTEKKIELDISDETYQHAKQRSRKRLETLNDYRTWLLQLTICDPACGSGAFLNEALNFLIAEHRYVDELSAKYNNDALMLSDVENSILENNLFGVDLNEESVEIAKLSLWLRTAQPNRKLNSLNHNIKCGNSLIDDPEVAGDKAFKWEEEFPSIFKEKHKKPYHITTTIHDSRTSKRMEKYKVRERREGSTKPHVVYFTPEDDLQMTQIIADVAKEDQLNILAYNICGDHIHLLLVCAIEEIPAIMQKIKGRTSYFHKGLKPLENKPLWQQKYSPPKEVSSTEQLLNTLKYIQTNRNKHELPPHPKALQNTINALCCSEAHAFRTEYTSGFDVVIGNPPYTYRNSITPHLKKYFNQNYKSIEGNFELYKFFIEKGISLINEKGLFSFITSSSFLIQKSFTKLRKFILDEVSILELSPLGPGVFEDATVDTVIFTFSKSKKIDSVVLKTPLNPFDIVSESYKIINKNRYLNNDNYVFDTQISEEMYVILDKVYKRSEILEDLFDIGVGINTGYIKGELTADSKIDDRYHLMVPGSGISRYGKCISDEWIMYDKEFVKSKGELGRTLPEERFFIQDKILIIRTRNLSMETRIVATLDLESKYNLNRLSNIISKDDNSILGLLGFLNSSFYNWLFSTKYLDYEIKPIYLKKCPIVKSGLNLIEPLSNKLFSKTVECESFSIKFQDYLKQKFQLEKLSKKLQNWHELDFGDFIKELNKAIKTSNKEHFKEGLQEVKTLTKKDEFEWLDLFEENKQKAVALKTEIDQTDKEIDVMVYELYGLTEAEIAIVESC
ncbi:N-6 DNA methylase [Flavobacteriaceae bacterium]|nr:N-6 DNA methylase [Flavobacteriaceae bacterium]